MKTITKAEYEALPVEKQRYWKKQSVYFGENFLRHEYTPVTISLEDAEGVIDWLKSKLDTFDHDDDTWNGYVNLCLTKALNKMKGV